MHSTASVPIVGKVGLTAYAQLTLVLGPVCVWAASVMMRVTLAL